MSVHPCLKKSQRALPTPTVDSYRLTPVATSATGNACRQKQGALVLLPNGQVGLRGDHPVNLEDFASAAEESKRAVMPLEGGFFDTTELLSPSKHCSKRLWQWEHWTMEILPLSVPAYLELQRSTEFLQKEAAVNGYHLPGDDPLRQHFANSLHWFMSLTDMTKAQMNTILQHACEDIIPETSNTPICLSPRAHCGDAWPSSTEGEQDESRDKSRRCGVTIEEVSNEEVEERESRKHGRESDNKWDPSTLSSPHPQCGRRSTQEASDEDPIEDVEYLWSRCPACFGGKCEDILVQIDACYTQKHSSKAGRDPHRIHPNTFFIPKAEVQAWKQLKVNEDSDKTNHFEKGADDTRIKGSTQFFDVTANMTLLCCHDHALFTVNINTAGEGQHFVLATLAKLFEHLPPTVGVHFLYDIGCQLHASCEKWGSLKPYHTRLSFAMSIVHAFGYQWPCQLIYHPCKCIGYGLSDGEGVERLWHALSHLIAYGHVAGYYVHMYNLDSQFNFYSEEGLYKLGLWLHQKVLACDEKMKDLEECLRVCGFSEEVLHREWEAQIKAQTKPLPRQHKNKGNEPCEMMTVELELETALKSLRKAHLKVTKKEDTLENERLHSEDPYLRMSTIKEARAGPFGMLVSQTAQWDPRISELARRYNRLCDDMETLIQQRKAPRNSVALLKIEIECLFTLDVDDNIWLDVGIGYEEEGDDTVPPLWLCNEKVQAGIRAMNDRDCCIEEQARLLKERSALQLWFNEEWHIVNAAIEHMSNAAVEHQLSLKKRELCCLFVVWERTLVGVPAKEGLPEWGPSGEDLAEYRDVHVLGGGIEIVKEAGYEYDVEFEAEADGLLIEHLDSLRITENYQDMQASGTSDL
ncbi:hypothetical protein BT96DRAFT_988503 [Gymnopus androsaceus JB14]|uniref:CxC2-like cysteine cluster KDZ transposase-associated domain-containing protein n=1 Tax=Gymnopus androsaceus JB14 TaxID=1447944 RepID=A0A6A4I8R6_9AGAR|nr:hypothetical protein BT96DRAFT_988503 [Gymnopus androsaceus JB14]